MQKIMPEFCKMVLFAVQIRVHTGYEIVEKLLNFSKEIPYKEKLWNFCGFNVCYFVYHFSRPSSTNLPGYSASLLLDRVKC